MNVRGLLSGLASAGPEAFPQRWAGGHLRTRCFNTVGIKQVRNLPEVLLAQIFRGVQTCCAATLAAKQDAAAGSAEVSFGPAQALPACCSRLFSQLQGQYLPSCSRAPGLEKQAAGEEQLKQQRRM